jgi:hypothetical protein
MSKRSLSRRTFLRGAFAGGAAVAVGLPVLDAMMSSSGTAFADGTVRPKRFATWFWGNGVVPGRTVPSTTGADWAPSEVLQGLADVRQHVHVVSGTQLPRARRTIEHLEGPIGILTGSNASAQDGRFDDFSYVTVSAPSVDEVAADFLGTPVHRSLVMAVTELHPAGPGAAIRYTSHRGPFAFNEPTFDPGALFDRVFAGAMPGSTPSEPSPRTRLRGRVLDAVREDGARLRAQLGPSDRIRLEQHLDGIRDLERRLSASASPDAATCTLPGRPGPAGSDRERARLFADLTALAFACDLTRVAAMEFSSPASHSTLPDIFTREEVNGTFHEYEHNHGYDARVVRGFQYLISCFGDFVRALAAVPDGDGTLLDSTIVLGTSDVSDGHNHGMADHPILIAGHCGLPERGTHVRLEGANSARAVLTCLRALGWREEAWGYDQLRTDAPITELLRTT